MSAPTPADLRKQYPEWRHLDDTALADALYAKFYRDMPREQFDAKIADAWSDIADQLSAGFTSGVKGVPIIGPSMLGGLEAVKGAVQGRSSEDVKATDAAQMEQYPVAAGIGEAAGIAAPFLIGGMLPATARLLGIESAAQTVPEMVVGGIGQGVISSADKAARGRGWL